MTKLLQRAIVAGILVLLHILVPVSVSHALEIKEVLTKSGVKALLVEDYTLPIISMSFSFKGGSTQDLRDHEGTVRLMTSLFDEGAGDLDSSRFRSILEENGIELGFSSSMESVSGSLRTLVSEKGRAAEMLRLALVEPKFENEAIERMRNAIRLGIVRAKKNPDSVLRTTTRQIVFAAHPYARSLSGTETSIDAINRDDLISMRQKLIARSNLTVGVVGAINEAELSNLLDVVFSELGADADLKKVPEVQPVLGKTVALEMPVPNASIALVYKGLLRSSPDFFAAHLMNHILGGGTFSSRLNNEIREKRGLVYGVYSSLATHEHAAYLSVGTSTRAENQEETLKIIRAELAKMASGGVTEEELADAKKYVTGAYAINNLDTSGKIARVLVAIQTQDLGIDYIEKRRDLIAAVTREDVGRIARELLAVKPTQVVVGPAKE